MNARIGFRFGAGWLLACVVFALAAGLPSAAKKAQPRRGQSSFFNSGKRLVLGVDVRTSRLNGPEQFLPVQLVVLNRSNASLTITRESFTLVRPDGVQLPVASTEEFWADYPRPRADLRTSRPFFENVFGRYPPPPYHWASLDFFPDKFSGVAPRDGWTLRLAEGAFGMLYFRHPPTAEPPPSGLYRLLMQPAGAEDTYVLDFVPYATEK